MADSHDIEIQEPSPSTPSPSIPLHLTGSLSGDTIQVEGDTGNFEFSVQLNVRSKQKNSDNFYHFPDINVSETQVSPNSNATSYMTPPITTTREDEDQTFVVDAPLHATDDGIMEKEWSNLYNNYTIVTRLRSGVLSPVTSYRPQSYGEIIRVNGSSRNKRKRKKKGTGNRDVLEAVLRRQSFPRRPCNSYIFFMISTWGMVKCSSFRATSKKLSQMWCKLPEHEKKVFEEMALKDIARYKRQLVLLKSDDHEEAIAGITSTWN